MDTFTLILGVVAGYAAARLVGWLNEPLGGAAALDDRVGGGAGQMTPADDAAPTMLSDGGQASPNDPEAQLAIRLHQLDPAITAFANAAAHPRECATQAEFKIAEALLADARVSLATALAYALGANWCLSSVGLAALAKRADRADALGQVLEHLDRLVPWSLHFALEYLTSLEPRPALGRAFMPAKDWWSDIVILPGVYHAYLERSAALGDDVAFPQGYAPQPAEAAPVVALLKRISHPSAAILLAEIESARLAAIDTPFLTSFGRFWTAGEANDTLITPAGWKASLAEARTAIDRKPPRSLLIIGDPLAGKSSLLRLLARDLAKSGWQVFEASGPDLQAGMQWIGQLEERIRRLIEEVGAGKKVIWYVPDLLHLARSGTHQGQSASILDQLIPAITSGRLVVWSEATPAAAGRLVQMRPGLRRQFEMLRLEPMEADETLALVETVGKTLVAKASLSIAPGTAQTTLDTAQQYLSAQCFPGAPLVLLRLAVSRAQSERRKSLSPVDVLETLSQLTGLPVSILDARASLDLTAVRQHFAAAVIGQDEAVSTVIERIAMLKAGLNDPGRPIGVLLFAGPTGTGKTELAKTTAEYLFGAPDRMIRLDMSEFQTAESVGRLLGEGPAGTDGETLISTVRKQPFSVLLLDEFEKAHPRIWDLFLQVFDDARLTDQMGQVADFRHCLIIMTSNIGATSHRTSGLGFAPGVDSFTSEQIQRAISQTWRPEFQNRIDKIIVFRPLTRELMRSILKKELDRVLARRGLKDRGWAVEWEASALEFLLEKGFSPEMGARPLKRAVDQYLLAPLASTIVERRYPEGEQFVFVKSDGRAIQAEFVDPDSDETWDEMRDGARSSAAAAGAAGDDAILPATLPAMILAPQGSPEEVAALENRLAAIEERLSAAAWGAAKDTLTQRMAEPAFWSDPERHAALARYALMDRLAAATETAAALAQRLTRASGRTGTGGRSGRYSRELVARLALQLHLVGAGLRDLDDNAAVEVAVEVEPALEGNADQDAARAWCQQLGAMYRAWADVRHMQASELKSRPGRAVPILLVAGFGAERVLKGEVGLHILEGGDGANGAAGRIAARVRIVPAPLGDMPAGRIASTVQEALAALPASVSVVRRYRSEPSPLVRNATGSWRTGRLDQVLRGDFDLLGADRT